MTDLLDPTLAALARRFEKPLIESDPVSWAKRALDIDLWSKQREILRLLEFVPKLAVPSCHDAGKSFIASLAAARFLAKYPPGTARVVSTAPTSSQVRSILWNEINALHTRSQDSDMPLPGRVTQTEWWIGNYQAGLGRKPSDYAPGTFSGLHAEHILIIIDEAGAIPNELWTGVDTLATNAGAVILAIGNPDDPQAEFKNVCENAPDNGWTMVRIPAWETPNLSGEPVTPKLQNVLLSKEWVEDKRTRWGEDDPRWSSKIAAEFPLESGMTVVRLADVQAAQRGEELMTGGVRWAASVQLGVDIAASADGDETTIYERRGNDGHASLVRPVGRAGGRHRSHSPGGPRVRRDVDPRRCHRRRVRLPVGGSAESSRCCHHAVRCGRAGQGSRPVREPPRGGALDDPRTPAPSGARPEPDGRGGRDPGPALERAVSHQEGKDHR
jgi:hypothetical protein